MVYSKKEILVMLQRLGNKYDLSRSEIEKANIYPFMHAFMHHALFKSNLYEDKDLLCLVDIYKIPLKHIYDFVAKDYCSKLVEKSSEFEVLKNDIDTLKVLVNKLSKEIQKYESIFNCKEIAQQQKR